MKYLLKTVVIVLVLCAVGIVLVLCAVGNVYAQSYDYSMEVINVVGTSTESAAAFNYFFTYVVIFFVVMLIPSLIIKTLVRS